MKNSNHNNKKRPEIICSDYAKDKFGHKFSIAKCPHCCNFFTVREDSIKSGNTKSCGCLKRKRKSNIYYFPLGCKYGIGFYDNSDGFFIFDLDKYNYIAQHYWLDRKTKNRLEPITCINGKTISMGRFLMNTPDGLECDHINGNPSDNRITNLRNCSHLENSHNKKTVKDKDNYGDFSFAKSQAIAKEIETYQFDNSFHFLGGVLEEISNLPEKNVYKIILRNLCRNSLNGMLSESNAINQIFQLIHDYKASSRTA